MTTALLNYIQAGKNIKSRLETIALPELNWKIICVFAFCIVFLATSFYAWQIVCSTKDYYLISKYQKEINTLSVENRNLQVSFAESAFLGEVLTKASAMNFQKINSIKYIEILNTNNPVVVVK